jgi:hypothetical protein
VFCVCMEDLEIGVYIIEFVQAWVVKYYVYQL